MHLSIFVFKFWHPAVTVCSCRLLPPPSAALTACHEIMTPHFSGCFSAQASQKGEQACINTRLFSYLSFHSDEWLPNVHKHQAGALVPSPVFLSWGLRSGGDHSFVTWVLFAD